ncbi:hypothetical protein CcaCcLH18_04378 [Colletotrichum camelliae]|nr:hypothetical protein CcaCcLH18_04378 [Colletotrichum camelliae]
MTVTTTTIATAPIALPIIIVSRLQLRSLAQVESPDDSGKGTASVYIIDKRLRVEFQHFADGGKFPMDVTAVVKTQSRLNAGNDRNFWMIGSGWLINPETAVVADLVIYDRSRRV